MKMEKERTEFQNERQRMMLETPVPSLVFKMALPTIVSMLVMSVYNMADTYFVSYLGTAATGAVGINLSLMSFIQMAGTALAMGANSFIARLLGQKRFADAESVLSVAFFTSVAIGLVTMVAGLLLLEPLVVFMGAKGEVIPYAIDYATYILLAAPFMMGVFVLNQCLRAEGAATLSMIGVVSGSLLNIALDPLFVTTFGLEVAGAAIATAISKFISFVILVAPYLRARTALRLRLGSFRLSREIATELVKMGFPTLARTGLTTLANVVTNNVASVFSDSALAAITVVNKIMTFVSSAVLGFGQGYQPVAGFNWGANRFDRVQRSFWFSAISSVASVSLLGVAAAIFAPQLMMIFTDYDQEMISIGALAIRTQCLAMPSVAWVIIVNMTYAGLGKAAGAAALSVVRQGVFFIPMVLLLPHLFGVYGLASVQGAADLLTLLMSVPLSVTILREICRKRRMQMGEAPLRRQMTHEPGGAG